MSQTGLAARRAAHQLLQAILADGRLLSEAIAAGTLSRLEPEDRARAQRLANDVLRDIEAADALLKPHLSRNPPLFVRNALRLGTVELATGGAAHGVVNGCVELVARNKRTATMKGLVNAVLRKVAVNAPDAWTRRKPARLPRWLREPLVMAWGKAGVRAIEAAHADGAPLDLTAKGDADALARAVGGTVLPTGSVRVAEAGQVSALPGFEAGDWWVQDAAAALPVRLARPRAEETALDLCAAPGGKTLQLAAAGARVTAVDISEGRMARVAENLTRTGLSAETRVADAFDVTGQFDLVLLDAPCSATGTIRRHPDLPHAKDGSEFAALIDQQARLIDHALSLIAPGGRLVYCTCSLLPDEGEVQIEEALARHPELRIDRDALTHPGVAPEWITPEGGLRLRPDHWSDLGGMDGFYIAILTKPGDSAGARQ